MRMVGWTSDGECLFGLTISICFTQMGDVFHLGKLTWGFGSSGIVFGLKLLKIHKLGANLLGWDTFEHSSLHFHFESQQLIERGGLVTACHLKMLDLQVPRFETSFSPKTAIKIVVLRAIRHPILNRAVGVAGLWRDGRHRQVRPLGTWSIPWTTLLLENKPVSYFFFKQISVSCRFCRLSQFHLNFCSFSLQIHPETGSLLAG